MKKLIQLLCVSLLLLMTNCQVEEATTANSQKENMTVEKLRKMTVFKELRQNEIDKKIDLKSKLNTLTKRTGKIAGSSINELLEGTIIDDKYAIQTTFKNITSYTFYVFRPNQTKSYENLVVTKDSLTNQTRTYLYKYSKLTNEIEDCSIITNYEKSNTMTNRIAATEYTQGCLKTTTLREICDGGPITPMVNIVMIYTETLFMT